MTPFVVLAVLMLSAPALARPAAPVVGQASVIDGDTIDIHARRVRLFGIDAPESRQLCREASGKSYRCGALAANELAGFIARRPVSCKPVNRDRYGRMIAVCTVGGIDLADWLVRRGLALDWPKYGGGRYAAAQKEARQGLKGVWKGRFEPPWEWRRRDTGRR